jgi:hypothetical protein
MPHQTSAGPYLITTSPSLINCSKCRAPVMAATVAGLDRHIDTACLTQLGELEVLMAGRDTFNLNGDRLSVRNPEKIRAGNYTHPVMAEHRCGSPIPREHIDPAWLEAATAIVVQACGGVIVGNDKIAFQPPF